MAGRKDTERKRVNAWTEKLTSGSRVYQAWDKDYRPSVLKDYYLGKQWHGVPRDEADRKYTINLIYPTIETQLPSLLFYRPVVKVDPRPSHEDDLNSQSSARAQLIQHTLQTFIDDRKVGFVAHTTLGVKDAFFRFGLIEVGYSADWIDNPNADKPVLKEGSDEPMTDASGEVILQPKKTPKPGSERLFLKRIPPQTARVSPSQRNILAENDWFAYYEWHRVADVQANWRYRHTASLKAGGSLSSNLAPTTAANDDDASEQQEQQAKAGMVKLWKIWDLRRKVKHVLADGHDKFLIEDEPCPYLPVAALKFIEIPDSWYPLPPVVNWIAPQDEINEIRESRRVHRRRFTRKYTVMDGSMDEGEIDKLLESNEDGTWAKRRVQENTILPIPDAPLDPGNTSFALAETKDDFAQITGVSGEQRGISEADTATQANIINVNSQIRDSKARVAVADWLGEICRLMLLAIRERMQLPFWVQINTDPFALDQQAMLQTAETWQQIEAQDVDDLDVDIKIDLSSLSPVAEEQQRQNWNQVLALLSNPQLLMILMSSPAILRKTLGFYGIKSEQEIQEIRRVGSELLAMQQAMQMATLQAKGGAGGMPPMGGEGVPSLAGQPGMPSGMPAPAPGGMTQ